MLKTSGSIKSKIWPGEGKVGIDINRAGREGSMLDENKLDGGEVDGSKVKNNEVEKKVQKRLKSKNLSKSILDFLISGAKIVFTELRQVFFKAPILYYFYLEYHIRIEIDVSSYATGGVFSQLTLDGLGQLHPIAFFSQMMIFAETRYKTHDGELLAIVETLKTWRHYLEGSQYEVFVLTDHNNLRRFMDKKNLSSR